MLTSHFSSASMIFLGSSPGSIKAPNSYSIKHHHTNLHTIIPHQIGILLICAIWNHIHLQKCRVMFSTSTLEMTKGLKLVTPKLQVFHILCTISITLSIAITSTTSSSATTSTTTAMVGANCCHSWCNFRYRRFKGTNKEHEEINGILIHVRY